MKDISAETYAITAGTDNTESRATLDGNNVGKFYLPRN